MSVIQQALKNEGLHLLADALPKKQRTVKVFQRLIAAMRAAEAEVDDNLRESERHLNEALQKNLDMQERVQKLETEVLQLRLKDRMGSIESLTVADKTKLLECSGVANGSS